MLIFQIFDDAYKSPLSCIVIDDIERLLGMVTFSFILNIFFPCYVSAFIPMNNFLKIILHLTSLLFNICVTSYSNLRYHKFAMRTLNHDLMC